MPKSVHELLLDDDLWAQVGQAANALHISNAGWLAEAAREKLDRDRAERPRTVAQPHA